MQNFIENKVLNSKKVISKITSYHSLVNSNINDKELNIRKIIELIEKENIIQYKALEEKISFTSKNLDLLKTNLHTLFKIYDILETYLANIDYIIGIFNSPDFMLKNSVSSTYESDMIDTLHELNIEYGKFKGTYKHKDNVYINEIVSSILANILLNLGTFITEDVNKQYTEFIDFLNTLFNKFKGGIIIYVKILQALLDHFNKGEYGNVIVFKILNTINSNKDSILNTGDSSNIKNDEKKLHIENPPLKRFNLLPGTACLPIDSIIQLIDKNKPAENNNSSSDETSSGSSSDETSSGSSSDDLLLVNEEVEDVVDEKIAKYLKKENDIHYSNKNNSNRKHRKHSKSPIHRKYKGGLEKNIDKKNQSILNKNLNKTIEKLEKYIKHKKISILILERINFTPIEYDISNVINEKYKQPDEYGITENLIKRFLITKPLNNIKNTWKFSCEILGDYKNGKNKFFILETLDGITYRIMTPWYESTAFSIPYYLVQNIIDYFTQTNKTTRASQYHNNMVKQALKNMFYSKKLDIDTIENISSSFDSTDIKNNILIHTRNHCFKILKNKINKIKANKDINEIIHSSKLYDIVIDSILESFKKASEGINKDVFNDTKLMQSEITLSFMVELNYISLQFLKNLHDLFNHDQVDSDIFSLSNEQKLIAIENMIEKNLLNTINTLFGDDNIYEIINTKSFIINY